MIKLEVEDYCQDCLNFEANVTMPDFYYGDGHVIYQTDTIIRCEKRTECEQIRKYLENKFKNKGEEK